jgi:pimeloyl-ACP methyl ester carboxylesterase
MWKAQLPALSKLGHVFVFDGPGHGKSDPPPPFTLEDHADALADAFGHLGIRRAILVGLSWGGMVAMRVALRYPQLVAALALLDTDAGAVHRGERLKNAALAVVASKLGIPPWLTRTQIAPLLFGKTTLGLRPELAVEAHRRIVGFDMDGVLRAVRAVSIERTDIRSHLGAVAVPTLVLCGEEDRATPLSRSRAIAQCIEGARLRVIPRSGHMTTLEAPNVVNAELLPFVTSALQNVP